MKIECPGWGAHPPTIVLGDDGNDDGHVVIAVCAECALLLPVDDDARRREYLRYLAGDAPDPRD